MAIFTAAQLKQFIPGQSTFTWKDALYSQTAANNFTLNSQYAPDQAVVDSITTLFSNIVTPLSNANGGNIHINSCYRSPLTNAKLNNGKGGATNSQHISGQAVDLDGIGSFTNRDMFNWIYNNVDFDQMIWEISKTGTKPVVGSPNGPIIDGQPDWVHVSFDNTVPNAKKPKQRKEVLLYIDNKSQGAITGLPKPNSTQTAAPINDNDSANKESVPNKQKTTEDTNGSQTIEQDLTKVFEQIERNVGNLEASDVDVTWGKKFNPSEDSDWIGLKQFLLYLASKFTPQSLLPFVELIPVMTVSSVTDTNSNENSDNNGKRYTPDGGTPSSIENNLAWADGAISQANKLKNKATRFATGANASNAANQTADLFSLDPYKEGLNFLGEESESSKTIREQRNVGVRVYGQLVLSPAAIEGTPSKPGAIGFKSLEVNAGSQADNGLARIKMSLVDVQGNKFTDINSPWAFIYDVRPGSVGGDFFFRYGWQIRVPDPNDYSDTSSYKFWNHPGWNIFDNGSSSGLKQKIMSQIIPGKQVITLTQAINTGTISVNDKNKRTGKSIVRTPCALFDEGISFDDSTGVVQVSRDILNEPDNNYVRLAILNPEIDMDENGAITATLNFMTTGSVVFKLPLDYAITTRRLFAFPIRNQVLLGDLLLALQNDAENYGFLAIQSSEARLKQSHLAAADTKQRAKDRNFDNYALVQGPDKGGNQGSIHPDEILITVDSKHMDMLSTPQYNSGVTIIRWFREVLENNDCVLLSAATGSGAGINSSWIITTTREANERQSVVKESNTDEGTISNQTLTIFTEEKDVFSYRFQGSLVSSMKVEKSETSNAMSISTDVNLIEADTVEASGDVPVKPITAADRKRNLQVIFSQMQNCTIECLCHPWIGPGKRVFVKGMGFFDGEYQVLEVTHKLDGHKFTSSIRGARILLKSEDDAKKAEDKNTSTINGNNNFTEPVKKQLADSTLVATPPAVQKIQAGAVITNANSLAPLPANFSTEQTLPTVNATKDSGKLIKLPKLLCNTYLGALTNLSFQPSFIALFSNAIPPTEDNITITKALWCEQRKSKGVDYDWLDSSTKSQVKEIILNTTKALSNGLVSYIDAETLGKKVNVKYTLQTPNGILTLGS